MLHRIVIPRMMSYPVRERREELGLTQDELASRAGVSRQFILRLEAGKAPGVSVDKLMRVLDQLDLALFVGVAGSNGDRFEEVDISDAEVKEAARLRAERREEYARAYALNREHYKFDVSLFPSGSLSLKMGVRTATDAADATDTAGAADTADAAHDAVACDNG